MEAKAVLGSALTSPPTLFQFFPSAEKLFPQARTLAASSPEYTKHQHGVGCYECHSMNGSDQHCGDPFHPAYNVDRYTPRCEQAIGNRVGKFPARYCTKIKGTNLKTNEVLIVRSCSLYPLDNTCGLFKFESTRYSGCLMSCNRDACNGAARKTGYSPGHARWITLISLFVCLAMRHFPLPEPL
ncbi:hypothetical protein RRG08_046096 [Elysia crispata]|uniref:Protein quiver n=1 Tax=Elysia crispata TaxID=231223 RepID=A0AAE1CSN5_9GAST|nr:hypothetical protein RRG08_046096 [Elysia crispata]